MTRNVGGLDRKSRWILGTGALIASFVAPLPRGWRLGLLSFGVSELVIAATQYCPINQAIGLNTHPDKIHKVTNAAVGVVRAMAS